MNAKIEFLDVGDVIPYEKNPRINDASVGRVAASIREFGFRQPIVVDKGHVIIAGHTRLKAAIELGMEKVPCIVAKDLTPEQCRAYRLADNKAGEASEWNELLLNEELEALLDFDMSQFGFEDADIDFGNLEQYMDPEKSEEYQAFEDKFKIKHTTDDCFTPERVFDAIVEWVGKKYGHEGKRVRPFYPGGDYINFDYPEGCLVLDNPPFSIMSEIVKFYIDKDIDFFLFMDARTTANYLAYGANIVIANKSIVFENGAEIGISFVTNLGDDRVYVAGSLYDAIDKAQPSESKQLEFYDYPDNLSTAMMLGKLSHYGSSFGIRNIEIVKAMDDGTKIFATGFFISDTMAEKVKAEKVKAEKVKAEKPKKTIVLSERERGIIEKLNALDAGTV